MNARPQTAQADDQAEHRQDIAELNRADHEQALLAAIVESSDDAIVSISMDLKILTWNRGAQRLLGFTADEAIGQPVTLYIPPDLHIYGLNLLKELQAHLDQPQSFEVPCLRKDGTCVDVWTVCFGIRDSNGQLLGMSAIHRDLTERKRVEREQGLLAAIVESSEDAIITAALDHTIRTWNSGAEKLYGYSAQEVIGKPLTMLLPPDRRGESEELFGKMLLGQAICQYETKRVRKDGTLIDVSLSESPVHDAAGKIVAVAAIGRDISERVRARKLESQLAAIVKSSGDAIYSIGPGHIVQSWNVGAERMFGFSAAESIGRRSPAISPAMQEPLDNVLHRVLDCGETVEFESQRRRKDGVTIDVAITASPMYDNAGTAMAIAVVARDITEHKRLEQKLEKSEEYFRSLIQASSDVVNVIDMSGKIVFAGGSQERIFQRKPQEVQGQMALAYIHPDDVPEATLRLSEIATKPHVLSYARLQRKDGTWCDCESLGKLVTNRDGEKYIILYTRDITERKQAERQLVAAREAALAASRAKSEFLSSMSHEIRTPMNAVLGMAELLTETELSSEQRRYLEVMATNGDALLELINSILDLAKIEAGRMQIEKTEFELTDLVEKTISTFGVRAHGKGLELAARIAPGVPGYLVGDPLRLRQILINLIGNAIKFTEVGEVILEVDHAPGAAQPGSLRFTVTDTGIGIACDQIDAIFSSFTQADSSTTRKYGGTGLGLAIAQRLVGLMDGRIWLESEVGRGSKFSFTARFGVARHVISPKAKVALSLDGYRVLVVDDHQINRLIVREMIAGCGAAVDEAESSQEALAAISRANAAGQPYKIILLDMRMPGVDGLEMARQIRAAGSAVTSIVPMLSSDDLKSQLVRLKEFKLNAYVVKPVTRRELFDAIRLGLAGGIPIISDVMPERSVAEIAIARPANQAPIRILIAEDSPDNRLVVSAYLRREPYQIDFAENGKQAVAMFKSQRYAMVLMDMQMPELDGLGATRLIRQWEIEQQSRQTPIVALTASVLEEDVRNALAAGCNMHLAKPLRKHTLLEVIRHTIMLHADAAPPTVTA